MAKDLKIRKSYEKEGFKLPVFEYRPDWPYLSIGFGNERDYFTENLSLLIASGMGIESSLSVLKDSVKSRRMKKLTIAVEEMVMSGMPLWQAFTRTKILHSRLIALVRAGEESGRLPEHLNLITIQQHKEKIFKSRLRSALIYPGIVLFLAIIVAIVGAWKVLPGLVSIFNEAKGTLPFNTRVLIWIGEFFKGYGFIAVPAFILVVLFLVFILFFYKKTKFIGDAILLKIPGIKDLVRGVELARFGYISGTLLQAGFQVDDALQSLREGTNYTVYEKFYNYLKTNIARGSSFKSAFADFRKTERFVPIPMQQLIMSAEKSGKLPETLIKIGIIFEEKTEAMSQDLATVLEPIVLIIVGLIVAFVASGIVGPIYGLSGQIQ